MKKLFIFIVFILILFFGCNQEVDIEQAIIEYCKTNEEIKLKDVTKFDWDTAYIDYDVYSQGKYINERYGIEGSFDGLISEEQYAIAFCKNSKLIKYIIFNSFNLIIDDTLPSKDKIPPIIYPDTTFTLKDDSTTGFSTLHLIIKQ